MAIKQCRNDSLDDSILLFLVADWSSILLLLDLYLVFTFTVFYRHDYIYQAALMRERFDKNKDVADVRVAQKLLKDGEEELFWKAHEQPRKCKCY